jgi:ParB-like chromosome segregation protein Spo0J
MMEEVLEKSVDEFRLVPVGSVYWKDSIRDFTREDIVNMAASLRTHGQIGPIVVKPADVEGLYEGVCGRLRYEGIKHAHLLDALVRVHRFSGEDEVLEWQLAENLHRKELSALEKISVYGRLAELRRKRFPKEKTVVAGIALAIEESTGTKPAERTVRKYLQIDAEIGKEARKICLPRPSEKGAIVKISHLEQISRVKDDGKQAELLSRTIHGQWTTSKLKKAVDQELGVDKPKPEPINTGLNLACPTCLETYELVHIGKGRHRLRKIVTVN